MNILFIIPPYLRRQTGFLQRSFLTMPYGVLSMITHAKGLANASVFDCNLWTEYEDKLKDRLMSSRPETVGISLMFDISYKYLRPIIDSVKAANANARILVGGTAATPNHRQILEECPEVDAVCHGEGELPFADYALTGNLNHPSWATAGNANPRKTVLVSLDSCIDIDYSLLDLDAYQDGIEEAYSPFARGRQGKKQFFVITSRGCPYKCVFCMNSLNPDKSIRNASVDAVITHVEKLISAHGMNVLTFFDDQILFDKKRAKEMFCRLKKFKLRIEMPNGISPSHLDEELIRIMREAGVDTLYVALESGSQFILNQMKKPVNLEQMREVVRLLRKYKYFILVHLVIGMPEETDEHRLETVQYIREIKPDLISPKIASPVYGSQLREDCIKKGYIKNAAVCRLGNFEITDNLINVPGRDNEGLAKQILYMHYRANFVENYRMSVGEYAVARHYFMHVARKYPHEIFAHHFLSLAMQKLHEPQAAVAAEQRRVMELIAEKDNREKFDYFGIKPCAAGAET